MITKEFNDESARMAHEKMRRELASFVARCFPDYELVQSGFSRDFVTEEVTIKLHLKQLGSARPVDDERHERHARNLLP